MNSDRPFLHIINEEGAVIGEAPREQIHRDGLLHEEVHVWFYTPQRELIFQHRRPGAETYPDLLDATVGGHVEIGDSSLATALKETREETGISVAEGDLQFLYTDRSRGEDPATNRINNVLRNVYAFLYTDDVERLQIEEGHGVGFEKLRFEQLRGLSQSQKTRFVPSVIEEEVPEVISRLA
jgi:8-oxo-dGTP pyrophosphatase MutT (NUDIX family)